MQDGAKALTPDLSRLLNPASVAIVGARDGLDSLGGRVVANLAEHSDFHGDLYLVNPGRSEVRGRRCWPSIAALPQAPDVAVIVVPATAAVAVLQECADAGVRFAIILSSGFSEAGEEGLRLQREMRRIVDQSAIRVYGPNCPGLYNMSRRIGFTFSPSFHLDRRTGPIGLVTQGGGLGRGIVQAMDRGFGVATWASTGNEVDLQVADFIACLAEAPEVRVIAVLLEGIKDGPRFVAAVRLAARRGKPVVLLKIGKSDYGVKAALSHTASISGSGAVNSAVFKQLGIVEVDDIDELVDTAGLLARHLPDPARPADLRNEIGIYCSSGGTAALVADIIGTHGVTLTTLAPETRAELAHHLPSYAAVDNPVDTTTIVLSNPAIVDATLSAMCRDPGVAMVLFPVPADYGEVTLENVQSAIRVQATSQVPIVPLWITDRRGSGFTAFADAGMVPVLSVARAAKAVKRWGDYARWRAAYRETATEAPVLCLAPADAVAAAVPLSETQAKLRLGQAGIAIPAGGLAQDADAAVAIARRVGYPVAAKVASAAIQHKSDIGGVVLGIADEAALRQAWHDIQAAVRTAMPDAPLDGLLVERMAPAGGAEMLVAVARDPVFGPVLTLGLGGIHVELFKDVTRRLLPVSADEVAVMLGELRAFPILQGARGKRRHDIAALCTLVAQLSDFVSARAGEIEEIELNPVWVGKEGEGVLVLDALVSTRQPAGA